MKNLYWNPGNIIFLDQESAVRIYQPHYRRNLLIDLSAMDLMSKLNTAGETGMSVADFSKGWQDDFRVSDATRFTLYDNAYANSAMFDSEKVLGVDDTMNAEEVVKLLITSGFLSSQWPIVYKHEKEHFGDEHKGSFYQQIGTECLMNRIQPTEWWTGQKFEADKLSTRENAYKYIQDRFLDGYLEDQVKGKSIIEVGCGTGYYTNRMSKVAERAVGVDYNPDYIEIAKKTWSKDGKDGATFGLLDIIDFSTNGQSLIEKKYDFVIMIDTFLFLFHPTYQPELYDNRFTVLKNLAKLIHENGRIVIMDPHPLFLTPYFGDPNHPFGVIESYNSHDFKIIPTMAEITDLLCSSGLAIRRVLEPKPVEEFKEIDKVAYEFYSEVPMWQVLELIPV